MSMDPGALTLRPARRSEAPVLARLSRDLIEAGLPWHYTPARIGRLMLDPDHVALVACHGGAVQGFALMHFGDDAAHLVLLAVQPGQRRRGLAARLLSWLERSARVAGMREVSLELRADNLGAFAFYQRQGFVQTALLPAYYGGHVAARRMLRDLR